MNKRYNYIVPAFDMCFIVTAILERNALHCSTSSPNVEPAPSWFALLHFTWTEGHKRNIKGIQYSKSLQQGPKALLNSTKT